MEIGTIHQVFDHGDGVFTVDFDLIDGENIERIEYGLSASSDDVAPVHVALKRMYNDSELDSFIIPVPVTVIVPTADMVRAERDRRIYMDLEFNGHTFSGNAKSYAAIEAKASVAADRSDMAADTVDWLAKGIPTTWTDVKGSEVPMSMDAMISLRNKWLLREQRLRQSARKLMAMKPTPDDYRTNENHWN